MNKLKKLLNSLIIVLIINTPIMVLADSGLDSNYKSSDSIVGALINTVLSLLSPILKILSVKVTDKDYNTYHIIVAITCILVIFIVTLVYIFKLNKKKETLKKLGISIIPVFIFLLFSFITKLPLIIYFLILTLYIIVYIIVMKKLIKKRINNTKEEINFNEEEFNKIAFNLYKEIQIAWCDFNLNKLKKLIDEKMYNEYTKKLEELQNNKQKNIMTDIEYKNNKIIDVRVEESIEIIECEMEVICYDYIINDKDEVIKGKKDKKYNYTYKLIFNKIKNNYILVNKKMSKIKQV